ncbi:Thioesterase superfamily [Penicillium sp. IBT 35674x]|nr:Thioesterase superfamily [Penicillium sp. IBT 35674x]
MLRPSYTRLSPSLTTLSPQLTPSPTRLLTQRSASYPLYANNHRFQSTAQSPYISTPPPPKQSRIRRVAGFVSIALIAFTAGLTYTSYRTVSKIMAEPILSDEQTLSAFKPVDEIAEEINTTLQNHPDAVALRANPDFKESRPHLKIPESMRPRSLTAGTLAGPNKIVVPPYVFSERDGKSLVSLMYLGSEICGHPGIIHGGLLATLLDEGLARCCFPALPNKIGVTANLNIDYRAPAMADSYVALRAETVKVEGRKAWVEGRIETLPLDGSDPVVLVQAKALFIEPKQAAALSQLYRGANE